MWGPAEPRRHNIEFAGPLRWRAPELLFDGDIAGADGNDRHVLGPSLASEVWSFGRTVYEVRLFAMTPGTPV
jgi:hypothetical protein